MHTGDFFYPLKENYIPKKSNLFFYQYYGEDKIEEVIQKAKNLSKDNSLNFFPDDFHNNMIILSFFDGCNNLNEVKNSIKEYYKLKKFPNFYFSKTITDFLERYYYPYSIEEEQKKFYHNSCCKEEAKIYENLIQTNKELFCSVCAKYDCQLHEREELAFDSPESYDIKEYLNNYKYLAEISYFKIVNTLNRNNEDINNLFLSNNLLKFLEEQRIKYNNILPNFKLNHMNELNFTNNIPSENSSTNLTENKENPINNNNNNNIDKCCSYFCYKNFLTISSEKQNQIYNLFKNVQLPIIYEMYLQKLCQIFKYDPCKIAKCMKLIEINNINSNKLIYCYIIYFRLISDEYFIDKLLNYDIINPIILDKGNKKNIMTQLRIKQLNILKKQNKILEYNPCTHLGNVPCNEFCPCFERGFCEKFCACNKKLCKLLYDGCKCKGNCLTSSCPCKVNGRECDPDLCLKCSNVLSLCQNNKLQKHLDIKLGVGDSDISGWGLFAKQVFNKGDLIGQYVGEFINNDESNIREEFRDIEKTTYMFALYDNYTIDSRYMGNNLRFANHSKNKQNARAEIVFENGKHKICLFALKDIKYDEEIFFDYDGQHKLSSKFEWIEDKPKSKKKLKMIKSANKEDEDDLLKKKKNRNDDFDDEDDEEFNEFSEESFYNNNNNKKKKKKNVIDKKEEKEEEKYNFDFIKTAVNKLQIQLEENEEKLEKEKNEKKKLKNIYNEENTLKDVKNIQTILGNIFPKYNDI